MVLDKIAEEANVQVSQDELTQYLIQSAAQYNMAPQDFVNALQQGNQLPALVGEVARNKALAIALGKVKVVDTAGKTVDLTGFVAVEGEEPVEGDDETVGADEAPAVEEAPAKAPAKKRAPAKKKADAEAPADDEAPADEAPAKAPAKKRAPAKKKADAAE
jgi:trigger factor